MLANSTYTQKSGDGTPMFSRPGKSTTYNYLCFSKDLSKKVEAVAVRNEEQSQDDFEDEEHRRELLEQSAEQLENISTPIHLIFQGAQ